MIASKGLKLYQWAARKASLGRRACAHGEMRAFRRPGCRRSSAPKAKSRCSQPKLLAAQSLTYKPPKWFLRWQPGLAKHKLPICIPTRIGGRCFPVGTRSVSTYLPDPCEPFRFVFTNLTFLAERGAVR